MPRSCMGVAGLDFSRLPATKWLQPCKPTPGVQDRFPARGYLRMVLRHGSLVMAPCAPSSRGVLPRKRCSDRSPNVSCGRGGRQLRVRPDRTGAAPQHYLRSTRHVSISLHPSSFHEGPDRGALIR